MEQKYKKLTGKERLVYKGKKLPFTILNYWQLNLSVLLLNMTRGGFAEYIVLCALKKAMPDALHQVKSGVEEYDIDGPEITIRGEKRPSRIEVKSAASVQLDTPDEKEPIRLADTRLRFSIKKAKFENDTEAKRHSDLYVFCHYMGERKTDNLLDLDLWEFYVYPTYKLDNGFLSEKTGVSIWCLKNELGVEAHRFDTLCQAVLDVQKDVEDYQNSHAED